MLRRNCFLLVLFLSVSIPMHFSCCSFLDSIEKGNQARYEAKCKRILPEGACYILRRDYQALLSYFERNEFKFLSVETYIGTINEIHEICTKICKVRLSDEIVYVLAYWLLRPTAGINEPSAQLETSTILQMMETSDLSFMSIVCLNLREQLEALGSNLVDSLRRLYIRRSNKLNDLISIILDRRVCYSSRVSSAVSPQPPSSGSAPIDIPGSGRNRMLSPDGSTSTPGVSPTVGSLPTQGTLTRGL